MTSGNNRGRATGPSFRIATRFIACALLILLAGTESRAQGSSECLRPVRDIYRRLSEYPTGERAYHLAYRVRTIMADSSRWKNSTSRIDLLMNGESVRYISPEMEIYRDSFHTVAVVPEHRMVQVSAVGTAAGTEEMWGRITPLNDSLFARLHVEACDEIRDGEGRLLKRISASADSATMAIAGVEKLDFTLDSSGTSLRTVTVHYPRPNRVAALEVTFERVDLDAPGAALALSPLSVLFDDRGELLPKYGGYRISDLRNSRSSSREQTP